ncbi:capsid protein [Neurospora crassa partitivirus 1]|nr:capsid protein [Neurospora crassa partitivirus 1]
MPKLVPRAPVTLPPAPPVPVPTASDNTTPAPVTPLNSIINAIGSDRNISTNDGAEFTIDVVPDHRFPLASWLFSISRTVPPSSYAPAPNASPASLLGYTYFMYIACLYLNDTHMRSSPSAYAREIHSDHFLNQFIESALDFPVPAFADLEFEALRFFNHPLANNLAYVGSEAGFSFFHDFGRFFTAGTFFGLHALLATMPGNTRLADARLAFAKMPVAHLVQPDDTRLTVTPGHLFGLVRDDHAYSNWLNIRLSTILSQSEIRTMASRPNAGRIPMFPLPDTPMDSINPYLFMMSISDQNIELLTSWVRNLSAFTSEIFPSSKTLRHFIQPGNSEVARHLVYELPPPTWHTNDIGHNITGTNPITDATNPFSPLHSERTHVQFAHDLKFRDSTHGPSPSADDNDSTYRTAAVPPASTTTWYASSVSTNTPPTQTDPITLRPIARDGQFATTPPAHIFEPVAELDAHAHHVAVITSGKLIEIGDMSAIILPVPHPRRNLFAENSHYLSGAIAIDHTISALTINRVDIENVTDEYLLRSPLGFVRGFFNRLRIPLFRQGLVAPAIFPPNVNNASEIVQGAVHVQHAQRASNVTNVFLSPDNDIHWIPVGTVPLWSSYRHRHLESGKWYVLPTLRHIYGTQTRSSHTLHPARRIPA